MYDGSPKKVTMLHVKKTLAAAFPDVAFEYGESGRGRAKRPCVTWDGGPAAADVTAAAPRLSAPRGYWYDKHIAFHRRMTPAEAEAYYAAEDARQEAERPAREAAERERRAAAKADGIAKAAETRRRKAALAGALSEAFPDVEFAITNNCGWFSAVWKGGPSAADALAVGEPLGLNPYNCTRYLSAAETAERDAVIADIQQRQPDCYIWRGRSLAQLREDLAELIAAEAKPKRIRAWFRHLAAPHPFGRARVKPQLWLPFSRLPRHAPAALADGLYIHHAR